MRLEPSAETAGSEQRSDIRERETGQTLAGVPSFGGWGAAQLAHTDGDEACSARESTRTREVGALGSLLATWTARSRQAGADGWPGSAAAWCSTNFVHATTEMFERSCRSGMANVSRDSSASVWMSGHGYTCGTRR